MILHPIIDLLKRIVVALPDYAGDGGLREYQLLNTITVEAGVSSLVITLPSGYTEYGLYVTALTSSGSVRKVVYHTSVASSRRLGLTNTSNTWTSGLKIIQIDKEPLGEHPYNIDRTVAISSGAFNSEVVSYAMPQNILITPESGTLTGGTIEIYGR